MCGRAKAPVDAEGIRVDCSNHKSSPLCEFPLDVASSSLELQLETFSCGMLAGNSVWWELYAGLFWHIVEHSSHSCHRSHVPGLPTASTRSDACSSKLLD